MAGSKTVFASPLEKIHPMGANPEGSLEHTGGQVFKGLDALRDSRAMGQGNASTSPSVSWGDMLTAPGSRFDLSTRETAIAEIAGGNCKFLCSQLFHFLFRETRLCCYSLKISYNLSCTITVKVIMHPRWCVIFLP